LGKSPEGGGNNRGEVVVDDSKLGKGGIGKGKKKKMKKEKSMKKPLKH